MGRRWLGTRTDEVLERALDHAERCVARKWTLSKRDFVESKPPWAEYIYHSTTLLKIRRGSCASVGCDKGCAQPHEVRQVFFPERWPTISTYMRVSSLCSCFRAPGQRGWLYPDPETGRHAWYEGGLAWNVDDQTLQFVDGKLQGVVQEGGEVKPFPEGLGGLVRTPKWLRKPTEGQTCKADLGGAVIDVLGSETSITGHAKRIRRLADAFREEKCFVGRRPLLAAAFAANLLRPGFVQRNKGAVFAARVSVGAAA